MDYLLRKGVLIYLYISIRGSAAILVHIGIHIVKSRIRIHLCLFLAAQPGKLIIILVKHLLELVAVAKDTGRTFSVQLVDKLIAGILTRHK